MLMCLVQRFLILSCMMFTACNIFSSHDDFMSYMMNHPNNLPENAHLVGQVGQPHNSPVDLRVKIQMKIEMELGPSHD
jgi:hypothetical protein